MRIDAANAPGADKIAPGTPPAERTDHGQEPEEIEQGNSQTQGRKSPQAKRIPAQPENWCGQGIGEYEELVRLQVMSSPHDRDGAQDQMLDSDDI